MPGEYDIDEELKAALSVTPSADFEARVLRRIEERAERRAWWWPAYAAAAAAAALLLVAGVTFLSRQEVTEPVPVTAVATPQPTPLSPRVSSTAPEPEAPVAPATGTSAAVSRAVVAQRARPTHGHAAPAFVPEVIVPSGNVAALQRLVEGLNNGTVEVPPAAPGVVPAVEAVDPDAPAVEALVVNPITVPAADAQQGGVSPVMRGF